MNWEIKDDLLKGLRQLATEKMRAGRLESKTTGIKAEIRTYNGIYTGEERG